LLKYNATGNLQNEQEFNGPDNFDDSGLSLTLNASGEPIVTGYTTQAASGKDYLTLGYSSSFNLQWQMIHSHSAGLDDIATDVTLDNDGNIIVTGQCSQAGTYKYITVKYQAIQPLQAIVSDSNNVPLYADHQVIVKFDPSVMKVNFINDRQAYFTDLGKAINSATLSVLTAKTGYDFSKGVTAVKIFSELTTNDTLTESRLGEPVRIPEFWSTLLLLVPGNYDIENIIDSLNTLDTLVYYSEPNHIMKSDAVPNDDLWNTQHGLFSTAYPDAHINAPDAWDIEVGKSLIRVGVVDRGIDYTHEDFSIDGSGTFPGSKIAGGNAYGYVGTPNVQNWTNPNPLDPYEHGTLTAGVIAALRNNETTSGSSGVAGIAGGDMDGSGNSGVTLFDLNGETQFSGSYPLLATTVAAAIEDGARSVNNGGWGLHIMNNSYGYPLLNSTLGAACRYAWKNDVCMVASRGNKDFPQSSENPTAHHYPATLDDRWVLSVGASFTNGLRKYRFQGNPIDTADYEFESYYGLNMDVIAPGVNILVNSTLPSSNYSVYNGSSAAAPHMAGLAALMMSQQNSSQINSPANLGMEDIEHLIQKYAFPVTDDPSNGGLTGLSVPNIYAGYGLLDAGEVLAHLDYPMWQVYHSGNPDAETVLSVVTGVPYVLSENINGVAAGTYDVDRYEVQHTYYYTFSPSTTIVDAWARFNSSVGFSIANPIGDNPWVNFTSSISGNTATITITTYSYRINHFYSYPYTTVNAWVPADPTTVKTRHSLLLYDPSLSGMENPEDNSGIVLYPNPATDQVTLAFTNTESSAVSYTVMDASGRTLLTGTPGTMGSGVQYLTIPVQSLAPGIYFCNLVVNGQMTTKKFIRSGQ